jgi:hypothetical protein
MPLCLCVYGHVGRSQRTSGGGFAAPPPEYPPIQTTHATMTLPLYLDLSRETVGAHAPNDTVVVKLGGLVRRFGVSWSLPVVGDLGVPRGRAGSTESRQRTPIDDGGDAAVPHHERSWSSSATSDAPTAASAPAPALLQPFKLAPSQLEHLLGRRGSAPGPTLPWT